MSVAALHRRFSKDATYRRAHEELGLWVELGLRCRSARERGGINKATLAVRLGVSSHGLTEFERGSERRPHVVVPLVRHWEAELRAEGFDPSPWLAVSVTPVAPETVTIVTRPPATVSTRDGRVASHPIWHVPA